MIFLVLGAENKFKKIPKSMRKEEGENFTSCVQHVHVQQHESIFYTTPLHWKSVKFLLTLTQWNVHLRSKITSSRKIQRCIVYGNYCILTYRLLNLSNDSVQQKDLRLIITTPQNICNRRIYDHLEGMIPQPKTVRYAKPRRYSSTVFVLLKDESHFALSAERQRKM